MARRAAPWRRGGANGPWWSTVRGKQVWLAPGTASKTEADRALIRILAGASTRPVAASAAAAERCPRVSPVRSPGRARVRSLAARDTRDRQASTCPSWCKTRSTGFAGATCGTRSGVLPPSESLPSGHPPSHKRTYGWLSGSILPSVQFWQCPDPPQLGQTCGPSSPPPDPPQVEHALWPPHSGQSTQVADRIAFSTS